MKLFHAIKDPYFPIMRPDIVRRMLFSYFYKKKEWPGKGYGEVIVDSGGFTARQKGVEISVSEYAAYLNRFNVEFAFNLDTMDPVETQENQTFLEKETRSYIIPIYHFSEWTDPAWRGLLDQFLEKYPMIGLGGVAMIAGSRLDKARFYRAVFARTRDKVRVHGLGITTETVLSKFPFYSCDSSSWSAPVRWGKWLGRDTRADRFRSWKIQATVKLEDRNDVLRENLLRWNEMEDRISRLWEAREITWEDLSYADARSAID